MKTIVILDLNTGLIDNWVPGRLTKGYTYRQWLVDEIKNHYVILVSSRLEHKGAETIRHIYEETGWVPNEWHFSPDQKFNRNLKRMFLLDRIFPKHGGPDKNQEYVAIEHDQHWRRFYAVYGVNNLWVEGDQILTDMELEAH